MEEERGGDLGHFAHDLRGGFFLLGFIFGFALVLLETGVVLADEAFDLGGVSLMSMREGR